MWSELDNLSSTQEIERLNVTGPPGTGKSTVAWAWACFKSFGSGTKNAKSILWVHLNQGNHSIHCCHFGFGTLRCYTKGSNQIQEALSGVNADVLVVDGVTNKEYGLFSSAASTWMIKDSSRRKVAFIMSASVSIASHHLKAARIKHWRMPS